MSTVVYRQAEKSDIPAMARIRAAEWGTEGGWRARIAGYMAGEIDPREALKPRIIYVAVEGDAVAGFIAGHLTRRYGCDGELQWINVIPERRGTRIAGQLLRRLAEWFPEQNALRVCVDVDPKNAAAVRFYTRHGAEHLNAHWLMWKDIKVVLGQP